MTDCIRLAHGGGGALMRDLIQQELRPLLPAQVLGRSGGGGEAAVVLHDAAVLPSAAGPLAFSCDGYVVQPLEFPGGDIGSLAVIGTANDLAMAGARPLYLSVSLILEEGLPLALLRRVVASMAAAAAEAGMEIATGDTKVVERGKADGIFISTSGIGLVEAPSAISPAAIRPGDGLLLSGDLGRHGMAILAARHGLDLQPPVLSDCAPLWPLVAALFAAGVQPHCLRDLTRGGLASAIDELARGAGVQIELDEAAIPFAPSVHSACELLGLDPLAMANEGRMVVICPAERAERALEYLRRHQPSASRIGTVVAKSDGTPRHPVSLRNPLGVLRPLELGRGEQLPRIC